MERIRIAKRQWLWAPVFVLLTAFVWGLFSAPVLADSTMSFTVTGTENYTYAQTIVEQVNEVRTSLGLSEVTLDATLTEAAMQRAAEISVYYSHTRPDGSGCFTVCDRGSTYRAENIALWQTSPSEVMADWIASEGHYANIIDSNMTSIGVGCFRDENGRWYWVQQFDNVSPTVTTATGSK